MPARHTVVVIEDDDDVRDLISAVLTGAGLSVHQAATAETGIAAVREHRPDLVILDYGLPDRNGIDTAAELRQLTQSPIFLLTAREDLVKGNHAGFTAAMAKPFRVGELRARVLELLSPPAM